MRAFLPPQPPALDCKCRSRVWCQCICHKLQGFRNSILQSSDGTMPIISDKLIPARQSRFNKLPLFKIYVSPVPLSVNIRISTPGHGCNVAEYRQSEAAELAVR